LLLVSIPGGGTRPTREPVGNTGSAARAGIAKTDTTIIAANNAPARLESFLFALIIDPPVLF
jgi:hypothetical protein